MVVPKGCCAIKRHIKINPKGQDRLFVFSPAPKKIACRAWFQSSALPWSAAVFLGRRMGAQAFCHPFIIAAVENVCLPDAPCGWHFFSDHLHLFCDAGEQVNQFLHPLLPRGFQEEKPSTQGMGVAPGLFHFVLEIGSPVVLYSPSLETRQEVDFRQGPAGRAWPKRSRAACGLWAANSRFPSPAYPSRQNVQPLQAAPEVLGWLPLNSPPWGTLLPRLPPLFLRTDGGGSLLSCADCFVSKNAPRNEIKK